MRYITRRYSDEMMYLSKLVVNDPKMKNEMHQHLIVTISSVLMITDDDPHGCVKIMVDAYYQVIAKNDFFTTNQEKYGKLKRKI